VGQPAAANTAAGDLQARTEQVVLFDDTAIASAAQRSSIISTNR
jgi:hypothetical protein